MNRERTLSRDVTATQIPSGDKLPLAAGSRVFIHQTLGGSYTVQAATLSDGAPDPEAVWAQLRQVFDPEIPVNIVDLGLVYLCELKEAEGGGTDVKIKMTLTAPGCGMGPVLAGDVKNKVESLPGVKNAEVEVVFDPVWDRSMMSDAAKLQLGMMW